MIIYRSFRNLLPHFVFTVSCLFSKSDAQIDPNFPLVTFPDANANITTSATKVYVTTVALLPRTGTSRFVAETFIDAADEFYRQLAGLEGYIEIPANAISTVQVNANLLLVTYNVRYNLLLLKNGGATDQTIVDTIGNYAEVSANVGNGIHALNSFYTFEPTGANFQFTGLSVCDSVDVSCAGSQVRCVETLAGTSVTCESPCKQGYCKNNGTCAQANVNSPPTCNCISRSDLWYIGEQCETMVALWMVILAVVGSLILIIIAVVLACCFYRAKRKKKEKEALAGDFRSITAASNAAYLKNERENGSSNNAATNGYKPRLEARAEPVVFRPRSPDDAWERRRQRRSLSSERNPRRSRSFERSNSSVSSFTEGSASSDSATYQPQNQGQAASTFPRSRSSDYTSSTASHPNPKSGTTDSEEFGDVENDVDISMRDQGTSPIRWIPSTKQPSGKIDITERKGWLPSLGPQMFNLETIQNEDEPGKPSSRIHDTDI